MGKQRKNKTRAGKAPTTLTPLQFAAAFYGGMFLLCLVVYHGIADNYLYNDDFLWLSYARHEMTLGNVY